MYTPKEGEDTILASAVQVSLLLECKLIFIIHHNYKELIIHG